MKNRSNREQDQPKQVVDLDPETIADLEVDDHDADRLKGGSSAGGGGWTEGGNTGLIVK